MPKIPNKIVSEKSKQEIITTDLPTHLVDTSSVTSMIIKFSKKNTINLGNYEYTSIELGVEIPINIEMSNTLSENLKIFRQSLRKISLEVEEALKEKTDEIANI
jgi:hypothetical protein